MKAIGKTLVSYTVMCGVCGCEDQQVQWVDTGKELPKPNIPVGWMVYQDSFTGKSLLCGKHFPDFSA